MQVESLKELFDSEAVTWYPAAGRTRVTIGLSRTAKNNIGRIQSQAGGFKMFKTLFMFPSVWDDGLIDIVGMACNHQPGQTKQGACNQST